MGKRRYAWRCVAAVGQTIKLGIAPARRGSFENRTTTRVHRHAGHRHARTRVPIGDERAAVGVPCAARATCAFAATSGWCRSTLIAGSSWSCWPRAGWAFTTWLQEVVPRRPNLADAGLSFSSRHMAGVRVLGFDSAFVHVHGRRGHGVFVRGPRQRMGRPMGKCSARDDPLDRAGAAGRFLAFGERARKPTGRSWT